MLNLQESSVLHVSYVLIVDISYRSYWGLR